MIRNYALLVFVLLLSFSCKYNKKPKQQLSAKWDTLTISTKGNLLSATDDPLIYRKDNIDYYTHFNYITHKLNFYNLQTKEFDLSISLYSSGPNKTEGISSTYNFAGDSIVNQVPNAIELIDFSGEILERLNLCTISPLLDKKYSLTGNSRLSFSNLKRLYYDNHTHSIVLPLYNKENGYDNMYKEPCFVEYNLTTKKSVQHKVGIPKELGKKFYGDLESPNIITKGDSIIYNYPFKSSVFVYTKKTKNTQEIEFEANHIPKVIVGEDISQRSNLQLLPKFLQGNKYHQIDYDRHNKLFYLLYSLKEGVDVPYNKYLVVFDEQLNKIGEVDINSDFSPKYAISEQGILFRSKKEETIKNLTLHVLNVEVEKKK